MRTKRILTDISRWFVALLVSVMAFPIASPALSDENKAYCDVSGEILISCPAEYAGEFTIPDGVRFVADGAFAGCQLLTAVEVPPSVEYIGVGAFSDCSALSLILVPLNCPIDIDTLGLPPACKVLRYGLAFASPPAWLRG